MGTFLKPSKKSLKNAQHFEFIDAFITVLAAAGLSSTMIPSVVVLPWTNAFLSSFILRRDIFV